MFLIPHLGLSITLPVSRCGYVEKVTLRKRDVLSIREYDDHCVVRIAKHVVPEFWDEHLRVDLPHRKVTRMLRWRWQ